MRSVKEKEQLCTPPRETFVSGSSCGRQYLMPNTEAARSGCTEVVLYLLLVAAFDKWPVLTGKLDDEGRYKITSGLMTALGR